MQDAEEKNKPNNPITEKNEVEESNDEHIDQDMPGYPHHPSQEEDLKKKKNKEDVDNDYA